MPYADKTLTCRECGATFVFSASEQEFYASKGFQNEPGRCPSCRAARKQQRGDTGSRMMSSGTGQTREMHSVVCAECGAPAQVPFVPRGDRPVYCSRCFDKVRGQH
jgi:CxxC-x17-CxxC domain-containing protein